MIEHARHLSIELEYQVFGRMPLAYSARCFTARHHQLTKDQCQFKCLQDEQGLLVKTQEGAAFAQINGIQTQSAKVSNLLNQTPQLIEQGIDIMRIVPVSAEDTLEVTKQLSHILEQQDPAPFNSHQLSHNYQFCNGYWFQIEGMSQVD
jgi:collagenase-like PrtC family protease